VRSGAFIAPRPVDPGPARPTPVAQPAVPPAGAAARDGTPRQGRVPSLIERVTGIARSRPPAPPTAPRAPAPSVQPAQSQSPRPPQQQLAPLEEPRPTTTQSKEDDLLDIPAFLRRQAN
jgi:cell division protein FtsZ